VSKELRVEDDRRQWLLKGLCRFKDPSHFRDTQLSREAKGETPLTGVSPSQKAGTTISRGYLTWTRGGSSSHPSTVSFVTFAEG
jgi:hypothetical protein